MNDPRLADLLDRYDRMLAEVQQMQTDVVELAASEPDPERRQKLTEIAEHGALKPPPFLAQTFRTLVEQADH